MNTAQLKQMIKDGALEKYSGLYSDIGAQTERFILAIDSFFVLWYNYCDFLHERYHYDT